MSSLFQILAHETPEERRSDLLRRRLARRRQCFTRRKAHMRSSSGAGPK
jgi:hypothetical protein